MRRPFLLVLSLLVLLLAACAGGEPAQDEEDAGPSGGGGEVVEDEGDGEGEAPADGSSGSGTLPALTMSYLGDEGTLTPFTHTTSPPLLDFVWDTLLVNDADNQLHPLVAESMEVSEDGTVYTFAIREGQTFHDGEPLTAQDVVFSYEYQSGIGFSVGLLDVVESVEAPDDSTVVMTLTEPNSDFGQNVLASIKIIPEHLYADVEDPSNRGGGDSLDLTVGSGPYRLVSYEPEQQYVMQANEDYTLGTALVDELTIAIIPEAQTAFAALQAGEVDLVSVPVEPQLVAQFEANADLELVTGSFFTAQLLHVNTERPPLDQVEVRRAIQLAVDPQDLIDTVVLGQGTAPNAGFIHPDSSLVDTTVPHEHAPDQAETLLEEVGAVDGDGDGVRELDGEPLSFTALVSSIETNAIRTIELVAEQVAEVGIQLTVETVEAQSLYDQVWPGFDVSQGRDYDVSMFSWQPVLQTRAGRFGSMVHSDTSAGGRGGLNISGYDDPEADQIVARIDAARTPEERREAVEDLTEHVAENAPFITFFYEDATYAFRTAPPGGWTYRNGLGIVDVVSFADLDVINGSD